MKITKKKPLRPRGRTDEKRQSAKDAIRDAYANLEGFSSSQIAEFLTKSGIPTVKGLPTWSSGSVLGIVPMM